MRKRLTVATTVEVPVETRIKLDEVALRRARRDGALRPTFRALMLEAVAELLRKEGL